MLRVELVDGAPITSWYEPPDLVLIDRGHWDRLDSAGRLELITREAAHHVGAWVYPARPRGWERISAGRLEQKGQRLALHVLVSDAAVWEAALAGIADCWELAERWGRSPAWCAARVALWRVEHPELAALVGPV